MRHRLARLAAILGSEGAAGIAARLRHRPAAVPPAPDLPARLPLCRHARGARAEARAAMLARGLTGIGVTLLPAGPGDGRDGGPVLHLGLPGDPGRIAPCDLLVPEDGDERRPGFPAAAGRAALVLAGTGGLLAALEHRVPGRPHVIALPGGPGVAQDLAFRRLAVFCGRMPAAAVDYRPVLRAGLAAGGPLRLCLSLPETPSRRASFLRHGLPGFAPVDGIRLLPGWRGAGASYRALARAALELGVGALTVAQDDLVPGPDFAARLALAERAVAGGDADFFSGLVTDVTPALRVHRSFDAQGARFVEFSHNVGLVLTVLGERALRHLAQWEDGGEDGAGGTIDRHLSRAGGLRALTLLPALAGHDPGLRSAAWSFRNARYDSMIRASSRRLARLVAQAPRDG